MTELLGTQVGNIRIVEHLASGGMGEVYVGHDVRLNRRVAVKSIRRDRRLDSEAKARFLREAQILSKLEHPNICRIHEYVDGDDADFLILELVDGKSLGSILRKGLKPADALRIAEQVAEVLRAAHAANVVHRDLKPDNVMITTDGEVKVLDFGISRSLEEDSAATQVLDNGRPKAADPVPADGESTMALSADASDHSDTAATTENLRTRVGSIMGTVAYMSPEQARGEHITAASDMYSFGLLLQEIFGGPPPIDTSLSGPDQLALAARGESVEASGFGHDLIVLVNRLKSLAPGERPTAIEALERLGWIRLKPRRRLRWLAGSLVVLSIIGAAAKYTFDLRRERNLAVAAKAAESQARGEAEIVAKFLVSLFEVSDPGTARGSTVTARELLDRGAAAIDSQGDLAPLTRARLIDTVGSVYRKLGLFDLAEPLLKQSLEIKRAESPEGDPTIADGMQMLANLYLDQGRYDEAEPLCRSALEIYEDHEDAEQLVAWALNNLGVILMRRGELEDAEDHLERSLRIKEAIYGDGDPQVSSNLTNLANIYNNLGKFDDAEYMYRRALRIRERALGDDHPDIALVLSNLAPVVAELGRLDEAERIYLRALAIKEKTLGNDHPEVGRTLNNLASFYIDHERHNNAGPLLERAIVILEHNKGPTHMDVAIGLYNLGEARRMSGEYRPAAEALKRSASIFADGSPFRAYPLKGLGDLALAQSDFEQALKYYRDAYSLRRRELPATDEVLIESQNDLIEVLRRLGRTVEADRVASD